MFPRFLLLLIVSALVGVPAAAPARQPLSLTDLSSEQRHQLRCTMVAGAIVHDVERGAMRDSFGLGPSDVERLTEGLGAALAAQHGADAETTRALLTADFEAYAAELANASPEEAQARLQQFAAGCRSLWSGDGMVPQAPTFHGRSVDAPFCFALNSVLSQAARDQAGGDTASSMAFARRANRIEAALLARAGKDEAALQAAQDSLLAAIDSFDAAAWDALEEQAAEAIMIWCEQLAGPDG